MRDLINILSLYENEAQNAQEIEAFKSVIASKIKTLPDDDATAKTLKEIEELLQHVSAGGRMGMIHNQLTAINDPAVTAYQKRLAQYIASMEVDPKDRAELFSMWKADKLVNIDVLLSKKSRSFDEVFNGYSTNPAIKELIDDVMEEAALGQGKGEFGLNVLSKSVSKPGKHYDPDAEGDEEAKGDLLMKFGGKWRKIEVKTTHGGAARFSDQEVRPAEGYEQAKSNLNAYVSSLARTNPVAQQLYGKKIPAYGVNLTNAIIILQSLPPKDQKHFLGLIEAVIKTIFGGAKGNVKDIANIMNAIKSFDDGAAKQLYSQASFNYYMSKKDDEGVLAINLNSKSFMFYTNAADLEKESLRLHADTIYLSANDVARGAYPQLAVIPTTFGANARAAAEKAKAAAEKKAQQDTMKAAKANPVDVPDMTAIKKQQADQKIYDYVTNVANTNGIFDQDVIDQLTMQTMDMLVQNMPPDQVRKELTNQVKQVKQQAKQQTQVVQQPAPVAESIRFGRQRRA